MRRFTFAIAALAVVALAAAHAELLLPSFDGYVTDQAEALSGEEKQKLEEMLRDFAARKGSRIGLLIVRSTQPETIEQYAKRAAQQWDAKGAKDGNSAMLVFATGDRAARFEIGDPGRRQLSWPVVPR